MSLIPNIDTSPTAQQLAREVMAELITASNGALISLADNAARALANLWQSPSYTPAQALEVLGTRAATVFAQHAAAVQYLWLDAARRTEFLAACARHGVEVQISAEGVPSFPCILPMSYHPGGTITLD